MVLSEEQISVEEVRSLAWSGRVRDALEITRLTPDPTCGAGPWNAASMSA